MVTVNPSGWLRDGQANLCRHLGNKVATLLSARPHTFLLCVYPGHHLANPSGQADLFVSCHVTATSWIVADLRDTVFLQ